MTMPPATRKSRGYAPARVRAALIGQVEAVATAAHALTPEQLALDSGLPGWDVHQLLLHIAHQIDLVPGCLAMPPAAADAAEIDLPTWALRSSRAAGEAGALGDMDSGPEPTGPEPSVEGGAADGAARIDEAIAQLDPVLEEAVRPDLLIPHAFGAMRMLDFTVTRLVELVVHSDDLARATGIQVTLDRQALAAAVRLLADALAVKAPGGAVEVRVPPFAVTQCVAGPRHTRGTPPNVVECGPLTWLRLATGRLEWDAARESGAVSASGERADLRGELPVLA